MVRIVEELGGVVGWDAKEFKIEFPGGEVVKAIGKGDGLKYVNRRDLRWISKELAKSHKGRPLRSQVKVNAVDVGMDYEMPNGLDGNGILTDGVTEGDSENQARENQESQKSVP